MAIDTSVPSKQSVTKQVSAKAEDSQAGKQAANRLLVPTMASMAKAKSNVATRPEARRKLGKQLQSSPPSADKSRPQDMRSSKAEFLPLNSMSAGAGRSQIGEEKESNGSRQGTAPKNVWGAGKRRDKVETRRVEVQGAAAAGTGERKDLSRRLQQPADQEATARPLLRAEATRMEAFVSPQVKLKAEEKRPKMQAGRNAARTAPEGGREGIRDMGPSRSAPRSSAELPIVARGECLASAQSAKELTPDEAGQHSTAGIETAASPTSMSLEGKLEATDNGAAEVALGGGLACGRRSSIEVLSGWPPPGTATLCPFWPTNTPSQWHPAIQVSDEGTPVGTSKEGKRWQKKLVVEGVSSSWSAAADIGETSPVSVLDLVDESPSPPFAESTSPGVGAAAELQGSLLAALEEIPRNPSASPEDRDSISTAGSFRSEAEASDLGYSQHKPLLVLLTSPSSSVSDRSGPKDGLRSLLEPFTAEDLKQFGEFEGMEQDLEYVRHTLVASGFGGQYTPPWHSRRLPLNPALFEELELTRVDTTAHARGEKQAEGRCQRRLLFDAVNEALARRLEPFLLLPPWVKRTRKVVRPKPKGKDLLREVWAEIHDWPVPTSDDVYDILDDAARRDMTRGSDKWCEMGEDEAAVVFELEALLFDGLLEEVIEGFMAVEKSRRAAERARTGQHRGGIKPGLSSGSCREEQLARVQSPQLSLMRRPRA